MGDLTFVDSVKILENKLKENILNIREIKTALTSEELATIRADPDRYHLPLERFVEAGLFTPICVLTFGNAGGKRMERILNVLQEKISEIQTPNILVSIISIDPMYAEPHYWDTFVPAVKEQFIQKKYTITNKNTPKLFTFLDCEEEKCIRGHMACIDQPFPSSYVDRDIAFTEQILRERSFAFADTCVPHGDHPFMKAIPFFKQVLRLGGYIIVDNDAWHEMNAPDLGVRYLQGRYMETFCEVPNAIRTFLNDPKTVFVHGNGSDSELFELKPFSEEFDPRTHVRRYRPITFGGRTKRRRLQRKSLKKRRQSRRR
jgi:hypothetical protein